MNIKSDSKNHLLAVFILFKDYSIRAKKYLRSMKTKVLARDLKSVSLIFSFFSSFIFSHERTKIFNSNN